LCLFVFNDTIEGPRAPALKPGRVTQAPDDSEGCSPVSGGRTIRPGSSWPSDDHPTPLRPSVDTGAGDRGGAPAEVAVVAGLRGLSAVERMMARWSSCRGESNLRTHGPKFCIFSSKVTRGLHPTQLSFQPRGWNTGLTKSDHVPKGTRGQLTPRGARCPPGSVCSKSVEHL